MTLPKYKDLMNFSNINKIDNEIFELQKSMLELRLKRLTKQRIKCHLFSHLKRRIAQLKFKRAAESKEN